RIAEVELGHRDRDVALRVADDALRVALGRVGERAVRLDHRLGAAGRAAGEEPDRGVVAVGGMWVERRRRLRQAPVELLLAYCEDRPRGRSEEHTSELQSPD